MAGKGKLSGKGKTTKSKSIKRKSKGKSHINKKIIENLYSNINLFYSFLFKADTWCKQNLEVMLDTLLNYCNIESNNVDCKDFKSALRDFKAPFNREETLVFINMLDVDIDGLIKIDNIKDNIITLFKREEEKALSFASSSLIKCPTRWIKIYFRCLLFAEVLHFPMHFDALLPTTTLVNTLTNLIRSHCKLYAPNILLYKSANSDPEDSIPQGYSLEELGWTGGLYFDPEETSLFFQVISVFPQHKYPRDACSLDECPILWSEITSPSKPADNLLEQVDRATVLCLGEFPREMDGSTAFRIEEIKRRKYDKISQLAGEFLPE